MILCLDKEYDQVVGFVEAKGRKLAEGKFIERGKRKNEKSNQVSRVLI